MKPTGNRCVWMMICLVLGTLQMLAGCDSDNQPRQPHEMYYFEQDFLSNPGLRADPRNTVILDLKPDSHAAFSETHEIPYTYSEASDYVFCFAEDEPFLTRLEILGGSGRLVAGLNKDEGCLQVTLPAGDYTHRLYHDGSRIPEEGTVAFMRVLRPGQKAGVKQNPNQTHSRASAIPEAPAFVALKAADADNDETYLAIAKKSFGDPAVSSNFLTLATPSDHPEYFLGFQHLFMFQAVNGQLNISDDPIFIGHYNFISLIGSPFTYFLFDCQQVPALCLANQEHPYSSNGVLMPVFEAYKDSETISIYLEDKGDNKIAIWVEGTFVLDRTSLYEESNDLFYYTEFAKDGSPPTLFEIAPGLKFYQDGANVPPLADGEVALFEGCNYTGRAFVLSASFPDSAVCTLSEIKSIKIQGAYTNLILFKEANYESWLDTFGVNVECLDTPIPGSDVGSIQAFNALTVFMASKNCEYCYLGGADFSDKNLDSAVLSYSDLSQTNFNSSSLKNVDFRYAKMNGARLDYANLLGANLCAASLDGSEESNYRAATLTGAYLKNVNLAKSLLSGASFASASFYADSDAECSPSECAFTSGCASAVGATMDGTNFSNAYLSGVDMSASNIRGAVFSNAVLDGVHFNGADMSRDPQTGASTDLTGAFIGGADFTNAIVTGATFSSAYIDIQGNCVLFTISSPHTYFPGYWNTPGDNPCVLFYYSNPTVTPTTSSENICPDGAPGPCSTEQWGSPKIPQDQSPQPSSTCTADQPLCQIDCDPNHPDEKCVDSEW